MKLSITENSNAKTIIATGTGKLPASSETGTPFGNIPIRGSFPYLRNSNQYIADSGYSGHLLYYCGIYVGNTSLLVAVETGTGKLPASSETGTPFGNIPIAGTIKRDIQLYGQKIQNLVFASATPKNEPIPAFITTVANNMRAAGRGKDEIQKPYSSFHKA